MGDVNSSETRVQPVFNALIDRQPDGRPWLSELWQLAAITRPGAVVAAPSDIGSLDPAETPADRPARIGTVFERTVAPPVAFLRWLLAHPEQMQVRDPVNFGANRDVSREWRRKLFSGDALQVAAAQDEAERQLAKRAALRGRHKWWAFEGFTHLDCCLITERCVIVIEGKRTEAVSPSTLWFAQRSQLWRNVEVAQEFATGKAFAVVLAVERDADGIAALDAAAKTLAPSYPHLTTKQQNKLSRHLLGFVTWSSLADRFELPRHLLAEAPSPVDDDASA